MPGSKPTPRGAGHEGPADTWALPPGSFVGLAMLSAPMRAVPVISVPGAGADIDADTDKVAKEERWTSKGQLPW